MTPDQTGAERYLASRMNNRDYREAYEAAVTGPMTAQVWAYEWTDECKPTAPATMSARQAACEILAQIDWQRVIEKLPMFDDMDPLVYDGLLSQLETINWLDHRRFMGTKKRSHLTAWVTTHMRNVSWCTNPDHHDGNLPVEPVERERRASNTPRVYCRFDGICPICDNPMTGPDYIVLTTHDRWVHEGCVP